MKHPSKYLVVNDLWVTGRRREGMRRHNVSIGGEKGWLSPGLLCYVINSSDSEQLYIS